MKPLSGVLGDAVDTEPKVPSALSSTLAPAKPVTYRAFGDIDQMRQSIFGNITNALSSSYPLENSRYRLELKNIRYLDDKPYSLDMQKKAIMRGESLNQRLGGEWHLIDKATGKAIDKKSSVIAHVPYVTDRGTFIYAGNEYTIANQMRLKPGVFTREKENGILEAHFNTRPGTGPSFRVYMEPQTGIFRLGVGQSTLKMYPILKAMGVPDEEIKKYWGKDLLHSNVEAEDPRAVSRAFTKLVSTRADQDVGGDDTEAVTKMGAVSLGGPNNTNLKSNPKELAAGIKVEKEHTPDKAIAKEIAQDHLDEIGDYYTRLKKMEGEAEEHKKEGQIGAKEHDRKWTQLWFPGKLRVSEHNDKPWVLLDIHKGLCEAAYDSLKREGVDAQPKYDDPHISVLRPDECEQIKRKHGHAWRGAAKDGTTLRFKLIRFVSCIPAGWTDKYDRVWFIECESPDLEKYREDLGFTTLPKHGKKEHDMRFHVTFAVHHNTAKKAAELLCEDRSEAGLGRVFLEKQAGENKEGTKLLGVFNKMELDPDVTTQTLGKPFTNAGTPALLRASQKLLNINSGKEEVDDRDSLAYQTLHGPEDFFAERIKKDAGQIGRKLLWRSTLRGNVKHIPSGALTPQLASVLLRSGMGMPLEETNPMDINDQIHRVIRLGEGGIPSLDSVPEEARNVQPSHFGFIDPIKAPESEKMGVDSRVSYKTLKGSDGQFYTDMHDKRGKPVRISAAQAARSIIAFPGEMKKPGDKIRAMVKAHQVQYVSKGDVDYELPSHTQMFSSGSNLVPLTSGIKGGRLLMGAKYVTQALPLKDAEAPLVQNLADDGKSFDEKYGEKVGAIRAKQAGVVTDIGKGGITVKYADGTKQTHEMYENFPFNRKTFIHNTPVVGIGDQVKPGQVLAKSNYTNDKGDLAIGTNLRVAYMPYKGLNFEDAVVISESAAKRLSSEHMYQHYLDEPDNHEISRKHFVSAYPTKYDRLQLNTVDENGVVKPGTHVKYGDPLILALKRAAPTAVHRSHKPLFTDASMTWNHEFEGVVTDVDTLKDGSPNITVKAYAPAVEGDKMAGRYGDKGVISKIVPDHEMIHDKDGKPYEILLNPLGVISRGNPSQLFEAALGKIARKRGEPYRVPAFNDESLVDSVKRELSRYNLSDTEDVTDPATGKVIPKIMTGERFMFKLHHTSESKGKGRGDTGAYTAEGIPAKGGEFGAKRISNMEINSLISHGATEVLRDAQVVRGQRNDEFWKNFRMGYNPPSPKVPFVYNKFLGFLQGAGINVKKEGNRLQLFALTDKDVDKFTAGPIQNTKTVENNNLEEIPGGLFDRGLTGGHGGNRWSHIQLSEPMPNPIMEEPIRRLLGLTQKKYEAVLSGRENIDGLSGGAGIKELLGRVKVDSALDYYKDVVKNGAKSKRDNAVKLVGYLQTMKKHNLDPQDWVMSKVPVIPPAMRPITQFQKMPLVADPNYLYKDLMLADNDLKDLKASAGSTNVADERLRLYDSFKAVTGLGDPVQPKTQERQVKGLLKHVFGPSPKFGMFQRRVLGMPVDIVGLATITPNPDLNMDQVGIPEPKAWTIYRPFLIRRLIRNGVSGIEAVRAVTNQTPVARKALDEEIKKRPVIINRAPTLHRYGFMAAWPVITKGNTLQIPPVVTQGFNADFDGDTMQYHVPVTDEAVQQAVDKMMPSHNLKAVRDFKVHYLPRNEFLMGLHLASTAKKDHGEPRLFRSKEDALAAYKRGEIELGDKVKIQGA